MKPPLDNLPNPKRDKSSAVGRSGWFPYYAGFSASFAEGALKLAGVRFPRVLDPWNGSGTTTAAASAKGLNTFGFDLNPVMVIAARARLLNKRERPSLLPLARLVVNMPTEPQPQITTDPLGLWFTPQSVARFRQLEFGLQHAFFGNQHWQPMVARVGYDEISDIAAFFYVALFRTVRELLSRFQSSNPTWLKTPATSKFRISPSNQSITHEFLKQIQSMDLALDQDNIDKDGKVRISVANSQNVPLPSHSIDFVLSSPPYCTRIDYASATRAELAVLGMQPGGDLCTLRSALLGTPTVPKKAPEINQMWGQTCENFLYSVSTHPSKASSGYYFKGHCQYFHGIYESLSEIRRCLVSDGKACLVLQDSFYKDVHNDLATIYTEMGKNLGLTLVGRRDFPLTKSMSTLNTASRAYGSPKVTAESVLVFRSA